jgi:molybdopterin molybdotransferase
MITIEKALEIIRLNVEPLEKEEVDLSNVLGRVLGEDIFSDVNVPPFNKSAMDGYACRKADLPGPLKVMEEIPAGKSPTKKIITGCCAKIMTGAEVPQGADTVIMKEFVEVTEGGTVMHLKEGGKSNICLLGEDIKEGDKILSAGTLIKAEHIAVLAGGGCSKVNVYKQPTVGIIATGSELVEPSVYPAKGQIRNSNGPQMVAQLVEMGLNVNYYGIVKDTLKDTHLSVSKAIEKNDVVILSGGVSVGDYDFVPQVLEEMGFEFLTTEISAKPGKHTLFARKGNKYVLGLPGNPVSSYVQLIITGKELLYGLQGYSYKPLRMRVRMSSPFGRRKTNRYEFVPVNINDKGEAELLSYHGSAHVHSLVFANALMEIPEGINKIEEGELVYVRPF